MRACVRGSGKSARAIACQASPRRRTARRAASISASASGANARTQRRDFAMSRPCQTQAPVMGAGTVMRRRYAKRRAESSARGKASPRRHEDHEGMASRLAPFISLRGLRVFVVKTAPPRRRLLRVSVLGFRRVFLRAFLRLALHLFAFLGGDAGARDLHRLGEVGIGAEADIDRVA